MEKYIGVKQVLLQPMNRAEYNFYRGWELPADEDGADEGYLVEYLDSPNSNHPDHKGYISWSPKAQADNAYRRINDPAVNHNDADGNPAGGSVTGVGFGIIWQNGPLGRGKDRKEPNGAFVETVIAAVIQRIQYYQNSKFKCRENALAITKLEEALHWLNSRTARREVQDVEGTHEGS